MWRYSVRMRQWRWKERGRGLTSWGKVRQISPSFPVKTQPLLVIQPQILESRILKSGWLHLWLWLTRHSLSFCSLQTSAVSAHLFSCSPVKNCTMTWLSAKKGPFHPFPKFALKLDSQNPFIPPHKAFPSPALVVMVINMRRKVGRGTHPPCWGTWLVINMS